MVNAETAKSVGSGSIYINRIRLRIIAICDRRYAIHVSLVGHRFGHPLKRDRKNLRSFLTQERSVRALQHKLDLDDIKGGADTPMDSNLKLPRAECPTENEKLTRGEQIRRYSQSRRA